MYYAYVVKSSHKEYYYKGHCHDLDKRIREHNLGMTRSLRPYIPVELIYSEQFETEQQAIEREKYFKSAAGRRFLKTKLAR
jgi:putative endonuclease